MESRFTPNAQHILRERYFAFIDGKQENEEEFFARISMGNENYLNELLLPLNFLPNSPTLFSLDVPGGGTLSACFKFDVSDTMVEDSNHNVAGSGIMDTSTKAALVTKWGGGVGYYVGELRPKGALVNSTHGKAMGPVAVLRYYNALGSMLTQSGKRAAAQMGILDADHPDVLEFIHMKDLDPQGLATFNISVAIGDEFMRKATSNPESDEAKLLDEIAISAWKTGDPGVFFVDRAERDNPTPWLGTLSGTNPCVTGDTRILTVYEGAVSFKELADRGTDTLVYAWNPDTKVPVVRWMRNPRMTRAETPILEVQFDSGLIVRCTPDHSFRAFRGQKVQAKDLIVGQSVRAFSISRHRDGHMRAHGWRDGKTIHQWVARMIWECYNGVVPAGQIIHHINHNETDNRIENLTVINPIEHNKEHYHSRLENGFFHNESREQALTRNHKVVAVYDGHTADVYNGTVDGVHTYIIADPDPIAGLYSGIVSANCGEVPLLNNEACNLGSINLRNMWDGESAFDSSRLANTTRLATRYLDDVLDRNRFPVEAVSTATLETRKLGLGVCGWADLLALCKIPYASRDALDMLGEILALMRKVSDEESLRLGEERGVAPAFAHTKESTYRNATRLCIAPTGTIAILMGASSGIEPHYLREWSRTLGDGTVLIESIPVSKEIGDFLPQTAMEIPWDWHVRHQAVAQQHVDLAVSKTVNLPNDATVEDIKAAYIKMWETGCKGGTVYRDGCRNEQVLNTIVNMYEEAEAYDIQAQKQEQCPACGAGIKYMEGCEYCIADCGWSACEL